MPKPRIIGGVAKGRALDTPLKGTRPSPARLREALFDMLQFHERGRFADLFSGSGAVGLEAASRGWTVTCVELARPAAGVIRRNARALGLDATVVQGDALRHAAEHPGHYRVVFAAPPYPLDLEGVFQRLLDAEPVAPGGCFVLQHPSRLPLQLRFRGRPAELRTRRYGSNAVSVLDVPPQDD